MARIVIVDDDAALRNDLADRLESWGHDVVQATDVSDGIASIDAFRPDVVLCDINMPSGSGFALREHVSHSNYHNLCMCFIFISSLADHRAVDYGLRSGADDYIVKPINFSDLRSTIELRLAEKNKSWSTRMLRAISCYVEPPRAKACVRPRNARPASRVFGRAPATEV